MFTEKEHLDKNLKGLGNDKVLRVLDEVVLEGNFFLKKIPLVWLL